MDVLEKLDLFLLESPLDTYVKAYKTSSGFSRDANLGKIKGLVKGKDKKFKATIAKKMGVNPFLLGEASMKALKSFIQSIKGKKDILKQVMNKFDLDNDEAERALELYEEIRGGK